MPYYVTPGHGLSYLIANKVGWDANHMTTWRTATQLTMFAHKESVLAIKKWLRSEIIVTVKGQ